LILLATGSLRTTVTTVCASSAKIIKGLKQKKKIFSKTDRPDVELIGHIQILQFKEFSIFNKVVLLFDQQPSTIKQLSNYFENHLVIVF
jgi:hypothetical protein